MMKVMLFAALLLSVFAQPECPPTPTPPPSAVDLDYFRADYDFYVGTRLSWGTGSELDSLEFNIYRAENVWGPRYLVNQWPIPAKHPGTAQGADYEFVDPYANGFLYWLEDVDSGGQATLHGPVTAGNLAVYDLISNGNLDNLGAGWSQWPADKQLFFESEEGSYVRLGACAEECFEGIGQGFQASGYYGPYVASVTYSFETVPAEDHKHDYATCFIYDGTQKVVELIYYWSSQGSTPGVVTEVMEIESLPMGPLQMTCMMDTNDDNQPSTIFIYSVHLTSYQKWPKLYLPVVGR
jgi:hypothetical protein